MTVYLIFVELSLSNFGFYFTDIVVVNVYNNKLFMTAAKLYFYGLHIGWFYQFVWRIKTCTTS